MIDKGTILLEHDILSIANACHDKIENEIYPTKHKSPSRTLNHLLDMFGFESLYQFTHFLKGKYNLDIDIEDIFIQQTIIRTAYVIKPEKRETILSYYKSIIRDIKLTQVLN